MADHLKKERWYEKFARRHYCTFENTSKSKTRQMPLKIRNNWKSEKKKKKKESENVRRKEEIIRSICPKKNLICESSIQVGKEQRLRSKSPVAKREGFRLRKRFSSGRRIDWRYAILGGMKWNEPIVPTIAGRLGISRRSAETLLLRRVMNCPARKNMAKRS